MRGPILLPLIFMCLTAGVANAQTAEWQRYTVKDEEFSVMLPALPAMDSENTFVLSLRKNRTQRVLGSYADGVAYAIWTFENPAKQSLEEFVQMMNRLGRYESISAPANVSVNGFSGVQFEVSTRSVPGTVQMFSTKRHLYRFAAIGAAAGDPRISQFFSSIVLGGKREGTEVRDGIGAQPVVDNQSNQPQVPTVTSKEADRRVVIVTKPEPEYTDSARQARTSGTVVLKMLFAANGGVTDVQVVSKLPFGLTEQAIKAAKQIRFVPAMKNGQYASMWLQVEYNFNLY